MDYRNMTNLALADECRARGIGAWGNKDQLIARLTANDQRTPSPTQEKLVVEIAAGPDAGAPESKLDAPTPPAAPATAAPAPATPPADDMALLFAELKAQRAHSEALQKQLDAQTAAAAVPPGPAEPASPEAIARATSGEKVFRTEFPLVQGAELGDGLHAHFMAETARLAVEAGYRIRGGARRYGWGTDEHGQRVALYEIYARK